MSRSRHFRPASQQDAQPFAWEFTDVQVQASEDGVTVDAVAFTAATVQHDVLSFESDELANAIEAIEELTAITAPAVHGLTGATEDGSADSMERLAFNTSYPALSDDFGAATVRLQTRLPELGLLPPASHDGSLSEGGSYTALWSAGAAPTQVFDVLPGQHGFSFAGETVPIASPAIHALDCAAPGGGDGFAATAVDASAAMPACCCCAGFASAAGGAVADPYVTSGYKWGNSTYGTPGGQVTWSIAGAGLTNQTGFANFFSGSTVSLSSMFNFDYAATITQAFNNWAAVANITFLQVADGGGNMGAGATGDIRICGGLVGGGASTLAWGFYPGTGGAGGDISIDTAETWTQSYFLEVVQHEIGHAIGLGHSSDPTSVMYFQTNGATTLQTDDINGARYIYGAAGGGGGPDFICSITSVSSTSGSAGQTITVNYTVTNQGQSGTGPEWKLFLSQDQTIAQLNESVDINVGTGYVYLNQQMPGGTTFSGTTSFQIPNNISGTWYLGLAVDNGGFIAESNNNNNVSTVRGITISAPPSGPDLQVTTFTLNQTSWTVGQTVTGSFTVTNTGDQTATGIGYMYIRISPDSTVAYPPDMGHLVQSADWGTDLGAGQSITRTFSYTPSSGHFSNGAGTYYVAIDADGLGDIPKSNNNNNNQSTVRQVNVSIPATGSVSINDVSITEGDAGTKLATFTVTRTGGTAAFAVDYATANNTATAGSDYVATNGTLSFGSGVNSQTFTVTINGDTTVEINELFFVNLSGATNGATISDSQGTGTITNDDVATGSVSISDVTITEGDAGTKTAVFTVTRAGGTAPFSVNYATADNTATAGSDYVATNGTLSFGTGINTFSFGVTINGDMTIESAESFFVNLSGATNGATISDSQGVGTISNDDVEPTGTIAISDVTITEGNGGTKLATFTVTRTGGTAAFGVNFATADGTATAGSDYVGRTGVLSFGNGVNSLNLNITLNGDTVVEGDETFFVDLFGAGNGATITDSRGVGTISNDDVAGSVSISDVSITEGDAGTKLATFTVTRTGGAAPFSVNYATANNTATAGSDYVGTNGTLSFGANVNTQTFTVTINGDTTIESAESFFVNLSGATNGATITNSQAVGTISNDDVEPTGTIAISDVTITEGNGGTKLATFTVTRTGGTAAFGVNFATADGTATAGSDYVGRTGVLSFGNGVNSLNLNITLNGDTVVEGDETFFVDLFGAGNGATITDSRGVGTISNDDVAGSVSISDVSITEGDAGTKLATFTVTRTGGAAPFSVNYATANNTATAGSDYVGTNGTLSFGANVNTQTFTVTINGDTTIESAESFFVNLSGATNGATITDSQAVGTISNDDVEPTGTIAISDVTITEGNGGTKLATFTVTRTGGTAAFGVNFATADGTATAGSDYVGRTGVLSFGNGVNSLNLNITLNGDTVVEGDEMFFVDLFGAGNGATITDSRGVGTISNDDVAVGSVSISDVTITEGNGGTKLATFTVTRTGGTAAFGVNFATADGTATAGSDYVGRTGVLSFGNGVNSLNLNITLNGDTVVEGDETFFVDLFGAGNGATITDSRGVGTISNDDVAVGSVSISDVTITEGNGGTKLATFTVTRTGGTAAFGVNFATADGTATAGSDYVGRTGVLSFGNGVNSLNLNITLNGDTVVEGDETFFVDLFGAGNGATITDSRGVGTITNDDAASALASAMVGNSAGPDALNFANPQEGGDVVADFVSGTDIIGIVKSGFGIDAGVGLGAGGSFDFAEHYFVSNASGTADETGHGQFLYNQTTDQLLWDADGLGATAAVLLVDFTADVNLRPTDFLLS